jgi:hypothetical protein
MGLALTLYTSIPEALVSNLSRDTCNPDWGFSCLCSVLQRKCRESIAVRPRPLYSKSISIDHSPVGRVGMENCCWSSPAHSFSVPGPPGLDHILFSHGSESHPVILSIDAIQGRLRRRNVNHKNNKKYVSNFLYSKIYTF